MFYEKYDFQKKQNSEKSGIALHFCNSFYVWPKRRQLDSLTCFWIQSVAIAYLL